MKDVVRFMSFVCMVLAVVIWLLLREEADFWLYFFLLGIYLRLDSDHA